MHRGLAAGFVATAFAVGGHWAPAQVPADQLMVPPAGAEKFVVLSSAGPHGSNSLWKAADGSIFLRQSVLLRGMVWEQDESIHFGRNGKPDRVVIRGVNPSGDAAETFTVSDGEARRKSQVDQGALQTATINPAHLVHADASTGSIAVGKKANLVLVDGDPSKRIGDLRRTVWVMSQGRLMNADELRSAVGFSGRPH